jgi:hypothetical protein
MSDHENVAVLFVQARRTVLSLPGASWVLFVLAKSRVGFPILKLTVFMDKDD